MLRTVHQQVEDNVAAVEPILDALLNSRPFREEPEGTNKQRVTKFFVLAERVQRAVLPHTACRKGCSHCCHQAVTIHTEEAKRIAQSTGRKMVFARMELDRSLVVTKYMRVPCPFLEDGKCSIYQIRPLSCRLYFNISDDPSLCDLSTVQDVPALDFSALTYMYVRAIEGVEWNDIREFFPQEGR